MSKLTILAGFGAGYVLGARAGRERYDQIVQKAQGIWRDPRVQEKTGQAEQLVKDKLPGTSTGTSPTNAGGTVGAS